MVSQTVITGIEALNRVLPGVSTDDLGKTFDPERLESQHMEWADFGLPVPQLSLNAEDFPSNLEEGPSSFVAFEESRNIENQVIEDMAGMLDEGENSKRAAPETPMVLIAGGTISMNSPWVDRLFTNPEKIFPREKGIKNIVKEFQASKHAIIDLNACAEAICKAVTGKSLSELQDPRWREYFRYTANLAGTGAEMQIPASGGNAALLWPAQSRGPDQFNAVRKYVKEQTGKDVHIPLIAVVTDPAQLLVDCNKNGHATMPPSQVLGTLGSFAVNFPETAAAADEAYLLHADGNRLRLIAHKRPGEQLEYITGLRNDESGLYSLYDEVMEPLKALADPETRTAQLPAIKRKVALIKNEGRPTGPDFAV